MNCIKRALISVTDKSGLAEFARGLNELSVEIFSSGGTARFLKEKDIPVREVSELTGFPEILDGRVKTLHPKIAGGILAIRDNPEHRKQCKKHGILLIDLIVVNLYAFEATIAKADASFEEAIENIDIGGPTLIRAAAKNHHDVVVLTDPGDYSSCLEEMKTNQSGIGEESRLKFARKAFALTAHYDSAITHYLENRESKDESLFPRTLYLKFQKKQDLRYGENPHQQAAVYNDIYPENASLAHAEQLHGKELSYNNFLDLDAALSTVQEFSGPACVIIKHSNPAGTAISETSLEEAFDKALDCDPLSAFGGIIGLNRPVDEKTAKKIRKDFYEAVIAPDFDGAALEILKQKKNLRLLKLPTLREPLLNDLWMLRKISGGLLIQDRDFDNIDLRQCKVPTKRQPNEEEWQALEFNWKVARHVKSNAIIFGYADRSIGVGAGQMSRIDSTKIAAMKSRHPIKGAVMASDAFFPFRDNIDEAAKLGITAIVSPGGSIRDEEVIAAANEHDIALVFTGIRHFLH